MRPRPLTRGERNALVPAHIVIAGWRNRNTTTRSSVVARPSANAKPFTVPTETTYKTTAARIVTTLADTMVRRARTHARWTAVRGLRPSRISSFSRSK